MRQFLLVAMLLGLFGSVVQAAENSDERIKKLEDLVKAQAARLEMLEKKDAAAQARAADIKLDATVQRAIDKAVAASSGTGAKYNSAFLAPDEPDVKGHRLFFTGEYTYTKVQKGDTTYAYHNSPNGGGFIFGPGSFAAGKAENTELDWSHGYRFGLGYRLPYDGWDLNVTYQHMESDSQTSTAVDSSTGANFLYTPDFMLPCDQALARQDFEYSKVNIEIGRRSKLTKTLSMRVFGGPSLVWLNDQDKFQFWDNTGLFLGLFPAFDGVNRGAEVKRDSDEFLYGIRVGAEGDLKLKYGLGVYGKAAASLLTGNQKQRTFRAIDNLDAPDGSFSAIEVLQDTKSEFHQVVPVVEVGAGVSWTHKINENFNLRVDMGYEFTNYFNVIERTDALIILRGNREKSDLGMHGLVFKVKLDF